MSVSWSPDSARLILLDQQRVPAFYAAHLVNGQWQKVKTSPTQGATYDTPYLSTPSLPSDAKTTLIELCDWVGDTMIKITKNLCCETFRPMRLGG
jgi:hypothetical protein